MSALLPLRSLLPHTSRRRTLASPSCAMPPLPLLVVYHRREWERAGAAVVHWFPWRPTSFLSRSPQAGRDQRPGAMLQAKERRRTQEKRCWRWRHSLHSIPGHTQTQGRTSS